MIRVARALGRTIQAVARDPYALTLWTFFALQEQERIDHNVERFRDIDRAGLVAFAFHEPKRLGEAWHDLHAELGGGRTMDENRALADEVARALRAHDAPAGSA